MDELALATNTDPVAFRLQYASTRATSPWSRRWRKAGWKPHVGASKNRRATCSPASPSVRGQTRVAVIAEVDVNRTTGKVWAKRFFVAHDCGQVIAPDLLRLTLEGQIVQTASRSLHEEVMFDNKGVTSTDWLSYPILDIKDAPEAIEIVLIDRP